MSSKLRKILKYIFALLLWRPLCIGLGSRYCYEGWHRAVITIYRDVPTKRVTIFTKASVVKDKLFALFDRCGVFLKCYAFLFISTVDWQFWLFIRDEWIACFLRVEKWTFVFLCGRCRCQALVYKQQTKKEYCYLLTFWILVTRSTEHFAVTEFHFLFQERYITSTVIT